MPSPKLLSTTPRRRPRVWLWGWVLVATSYSPLTAQTTGPVTFQSTSGLRIQVATDRDQVSDEDLADALEQAAQRLRQAHSLTKGQTNSFLTAANRNLPTETTAPPELTSNPAGVGEWSPRQAWVIGPTSLLWTPPLANLWSPRLSLIRSNLENESTSKTYDTALGGVYPMVRRNLGSGPEDALQLDFSGVVFSRWADADTAVAMDFRFGLPLTWSIGPWQGFVGFEHTSTHLGDEFILKSGRQRITNIRDDIAVGLGYHFWDDFRVYGQVAYAVNFMTPLHEGQPWRFDWGAEWCSRKATGAWGRPFAALDFEMRGEQDYETNISAQVGWMWRGYDNGPTLRLALQYYDGLSPFGQFYLDRERWWGVNLSIGF